MAWRVAKSLLTLRDQVNAKWPNRSKLSDGFIGDTSHSSKVSDHNPNPAGVVCAFDITHDPAHGLDARTLADALLASFDSRIKYIISNSQIASSYKSGTRMPWKWGKYTGVNQHKKHVHVSVQSSPVLYDMASDWNLSKVAAGSVPGSVKQIQALLIAKVFSPGPVDGKMGPKTISAIKALQRASNLPASGVMDAATWNTLQKPSASPGAPVALLATVPDLPPSNPAIAMAFFQERGWEKHQSAAIVGHAQQESYKDLRPNAIGDAGKSLGIFQWNGPRQAGLKDFASGLGIDFRDFMTQLRFVEFELATTEKRTKELLKKSKTVDEAVKAFMGFERPTGFTWENPEKGHGYANRLRNAEALLK